MGFFDSIASAFKSVGKWVAKGAVKVIRGIGKAAPFVRRIAQGVSKAARIVSVIPGLRPIAGLVRGIADDVAFGSRLAGEAAGAFEDIHSGKNVARGIGTIADLGGRALRAGRR